MNTNSGRSYKHELERISGCLTLVITLMIASSCSAQTPSSASEPPFRLEQRPVVVAHRGGALEAPENTLAAVRRAINVGSDWQEIDVRLSKDLKVVVMHDETVDRTTDGTGLLGEMYAERLFGLSAGDPEIQGKVKVLIKLLGINTPDFGDRFIQEKVPSLEQVLHLDNSRIMIEIKRDARAELVVQKVLDVIRTSKAEKRVAVASFDHAILEQVYAQDPSILLIGIANSEETVKETLQLPIRALAVRSNLVEFALERAPADIAIWAYTVYDPSQIDDLIEKGVHGVVTDVPAGVIKYLSSETEAPD